MYFGQVGRRELSGKRKTKKCCQVPGFVCQSHKLCNLGSPRCVQAVIFVVSVVHPCLATKEHQQQAVQKLSLGIFREESDSCAIKTHVIKLYIAALFFFFFSPKGL